jgi:autotransporter-associated beta strand protein
MNHRINVLPVFPSRLIFVSNCRKGRRWLFCLFFIYTTIFALNSSRAAVLSWSGGGANANWNNTANWGFAGIPANGDTVVFPASQPNQLNTNNIAGLVLNQIRFAGASGGYDLRGNAFTLTDSIWATNTTGANTIRNSITLATGNVLMVVSNGVSLTLDGNLSGNVGVTKTGSGTLLYQCTGNDTYTGSTWVSGGTLQLNCSGVNAISGPLVIGDDTGSGSPTVVDLQPAELENLPSVTVNRNGLLDLNGFNEPVLTQNLTLSAGTISTGAGTLTLAANSTITLPLSFSQSDESYIKGNLNTASGTLTIQGTGLYGGLFFWCNVNGLANIVQTNAYIIWNGNNTYTGNYTANGAGEIALYAPQALGNTNNALTLNDNTAVGLYSQINVTNQSVTLNGTHNGSNGYNMNVHDPGLCSWHANFTNNLGFNIAMYTNAALNLVGPISGPGDLTELGFGMLTLSGTNANTYTGTTTVAGGTLLLGKPAYVEAVRGPLVIGTGNTVRLLNSGQIWNGSTPVMLADSSLLDLNGFADWVGPINLQGAQITMGASGFLYFSGDITVNASSVTQSVISGSGSIWGLILTITNTGHNYSPDLWLSANLTSGGPTNGLIKTGAGEVTLTGNNSFTGSVTVNGGSLWAQTSTALGNTNAPATVNNGGSLFLDGTGLDFGLKPLILNGSGYYFGALICQGSSSWEGPITLATDSTIYQFAASSLTLNGQISGFGSYIKSGPGTNTLAGVGSNPYWGQTFVNDGTLNLGSVSWSIGVGTLNIGDGIGSPGSAIVREFSYNQIYHSSVIINSDGFLDLNGYNDIIGPIVTLNGGANIQNFGAGMLTLVDGTTLGVFGGDSSISGNLNVGSTNTTCVWTNTGSLAMNASVSGAATILKTGGGMTYLVASNSFTGLFVVQQGYLDVMNNYALGSTASGTVVSNGATLWLGDLYGGNYGITNETLTLNGAGAPGSWGALDVEHGTNTWAGPIILNANSTIAAYIPGSQLHLNGPISGAGGVELIGAYSGGGTQFFEGSAANTYSGLTTMDAGNTLLLNKSISANAVKGNLVVNGTVRLGNSEQIAPTADVLVNGGGLFDFGPFYQDLNTLRGTGSVTFGVGGYLAIGASGGSSEFDGLISGTGYPGGYTVGKFGPGTFTMTGNNTYQNGSYVYGGKLIINGSQPQSPVYVGSGATLGGSGTVGTIAADGIVSPGHSPGILNSSNVTFSSAGSLAVTLNGTNAGTGYSQLNVTGTVSLASALLQVSAGTVGAVNSHYTILNNDSSDPITGIFNGLPEGSQLVANNGANFIISYQCGSGNDVVLTQTSLPPPPKATGIVQLTGGSIQLNGSGITNLAYTVWANTNLATTNWISIGAAVAPASNNTFQFIDLNATNFNRRFYRFSWP